MGPRSWTNQVTCLNCSCTVDWTAFECPSCGRNPREKEPIIEICFPRRRLTPRAHDRREYPRYDFQGKVVLNNSFEGELVDLCQKGAKLKTPLRVFRDEVVDLDFTIRNVPIQIRARVIHVKKGVLDERFILGVFFETIARDLSEFLNRHLQKVSEERMGTQRFA
jgi:hypothetical protein